MPAQLTPPQMIRALAHLADEKEWRKDLKGLNRRVGNIGVQFARAAMRRGSRQLAAAARAIRSSPTPTAARIVVTSSKTVPQALAAVYGTKRPTGWLAGWRKGRVIPARALGFAGYRNNPEHVGTDWTVATRGEGPHGVNDGLDDGTDEIVAAWEDETSALMIRAFQHR